MKRLVLLLSLALLLVLAACGGAQPSGQEILPTTEGVTGEQPTAEPIVATPAEGDSGEVIGGNVIPILAGTSWQWVDTTTPTETIVAVDPARYVITFNEDGTANITADCNSVTATFTADETGALTIMPGASTAVGCPEDTQDTLFLSALANATNYFAIDTGNDLYIDQAADAGTMRLQPVTAGGPESLPPTTSLTGTTWEWVSVIDPMGQTASADPTRYTILFNEDGTAVIGADCNQVMATYTVADSALTIVPGATTLAMCPPDSQAGPFVVGLGAAAVYFFQDGHLYIDQFASAGTMKFAPVGAADTEAGGGAGEETAEEPGKGETTVPAGGLVGTQWQLTSITKVDGNITINDPTRYAITFNADGTANLVTDCNVGGATYTTGEGNSLTITPGVSTMAFCGIGSFDQIFLGGLTNAQGYRLEEGNLLIDMLYESGTLVFVPAP